jgi:general secretion pathway protein G
MILRDTRYTKAAVRAGFTLMELLVVVAILVVLAGVGGVTYIKYLDSARLDTAKAQVKILSDVVQTYYVKHGEYPANLAVLLEREADGSKPYLDDPGALRTPFGTMYQYDPSGARNGGNKPDIWADTPGGQIGNWPQ